MTITKFLWDKRIVVTGAAGTVGEELVRQLLDYPVQEVRALDNNESALFFLGEKYRGERRFQAFLADVRDHAKITSMLAGIDYVFHAAAFKHVPLCERSPFDAVQTNIIGVQNIIQAALYNKISKVLFTSSDKAVNPTNVMGTSKLMGERLITAANAMKHGGEGPVFASTRFGNVAGSRGSVIPLFCQQIASGGPITLTDPSMTRFVMTLADAVRLVITSMFFARGGEVFITKMSVMRIADLAEVMINLLSPHYGFVPGDIRISYMGPRPGEKFYEELMNDEETRRSYDTQQLFIVMPAIRNIYTNIDYTYEGLDMTMVEKTYHSSNVIPMSTLEISKFLLQPDVLSENIRIQLQKSGGVS